MYAQHVKELTMKRVKLQNSGWIVQFVKVGIIHDALNMMASTKMNSMKLILFVVFVLSRHLVSRNYIIFNIT